MGDVMTMVERGADLARTKVAWIGDGNNMAHSWINASVYFPFELVLACPEGYKPNAAILDAALKAGGKVRLVTDPAEAIRGANYVNTDVWASMGQEGEADERMGVFKHYQVNAKAMATAAVGAKFMHCLPAHRGEEVVDAVIDGPRSLVWDEAENRIHAQKSVLLWALGKL